MSVSLPFADQLRQAHELLDEIPPHKLEAVHLLLTVLAEDPSFTMETAPLEELPLSDLAIARIQDSLKASESKETISHEDILREFGLSK